MKNVEAATRWKQLPEVFHKKGAFKIFAKFRGKHLCQSLFFDKVVGLRPQAYNFIKKETLAQVFSSEFCIIFNTFLTEHPRATRIMKLLS